jgi:hypothetical protein
MALSQYSYEIKFISGVDNGIADSMSRLCRNNMTELSHVYTTSEVLCSNIIEKFKLTPFQYKTISSLHNSTVGHFGLERTMKRLNDINQKSTTTCSMVYRSLSLLPENEHVKDTSSCT